ncbi:hypothetical protein B566_EDAN009573 [Ephemera danica]|nr:hypothetical protein B566_EDAN009573 [Ephemera danica]
MRVRAMEIPPEIDMEPEELVPCANCGRTFAISSVERHFKICVNTTLHQNYHQRRKFDSSRQRIQGTELEQYLPTPPIKPSNRPRSRSVPGGGRRGSASSVNEQQCQFCGRTFGEKAIDRHREWCQSQAALKQLQHPTNHTSPAYERMQARTKYRAPLTKTLRAKTREKYSPGGVTLNSTPSNSNSHLAKNHLQKRASLPNTTPTSRGRERSDKYDVYLSAERQLKELGLLETCGSPVPSRRGATPESPPQSSPSPASLVQSSSLTSSNELLIVIEDEEEYLINKLAEESDAKTTPTLKAEEKRENVQSPMLSRELFNTNTVHNHNLDINSKADLMKKEDTRLQNINKLKKQESYNDLTSVDSTNDLTTTEAEMFFKTLKEKLERPDVTKEISQEECPLTQSLQYLDAALSLFQMEDIPVRAADAPRSKASTKRRLYSAASPFSLLSPDPTMMMSPPAPVADDKCSDCGSPFPVPSARFCCLCGARREML